MLLAMWRIQNEFLPGTLWIPERPPDTVVLLSDRYFTGIGAVLLNASAIPEEDTPVSLGMRNLKLPGAL